MLRYLNSGERRYGRRTSAVTLRKHWEFQAVVMGQCAAILEPGEPTALERRRLWVFAPESPHGWWNPPDETCRIVVMHFSHAPGALRDVVERRGHLSVPLSVGDARRVQALHDELVPHYRRMNSLSAMVFDRAMLELSMMALQHEPVTPLAQSGDYARRKVEQAMQWYAEHLALGPSVADLARAVYVSPPHLRRLFHLATGRSPLVAMNQLRMDAAKRLMAGSDQSLKAVAIACGFSGPTVFSRAFRAHEGLSPAQWRTTSVLHPGRTPR